GNRVGQILPGGKHGSQIVISDRKVGLEPNGVLEGCDRMVHLHKCEKRDTLIVIGFRKIRLETDCLGIGRHRGSMFCYGRKRDRTIEMRRGVVRLELNRPVKRADGAVHVTFALEQKTTIEMRCDESVIKLDGFAKGG